MVKGIDYTGISVVYLCHDGKGKFLLAKRSNQTRDEHGKWEPGGGGLGFGETIEDALRREIKEEYCCEVLGFEFLGYRDVHRTHEGKKTHWIGLDFKVLVDPKQAKNNEPEMIEEMGWFTLDNLPKELHSEMPKFMEKYKDKLPK